MHEAQFSRVISVYVKCVIKNINEDKTISFLISVISFSGVQFVNPVAFTSHYICSQCHLSIITKQNNQNNPATKLSADYSKILKMIKTIMLN